MLGGDLVEAIILGILQGLTEFLPISSSAHLLVLPWFLGWEPKGMAFDAVLHLGTLLAVLFYFRKEWIGLGIDFLRSYRKSDLSATEGGRLALTLLLGTIPAVLFALVAAEWIEQHMRTPAATVLTLSLFGLWLGWADLRGRLTREVSQVRPVEGFGIGCAQALALMPGVSRSGVTIAAALVLGLKRAEAARFSFLLGTPVIALAGGKSLWDLIRSPAGAEIGTVFLLAGVLFSFISGFLCIKYFLSYLRTRSFLPFVVYRLLLAAVIYFVLV